MKRLLLIISAILSLVTLQAQVSDGYLTNEDYVTISVLVDENGEKRYYLAASSSGVYTTEDVNDDCLWQLGVIQTNGAYSYTLNNITTARYLAITENAQSPSYQLQANPCTFSFTRTDEGAKNKPGICSYGKLYYNFYYSQWWSWVSVYLAQGGWWPFQFGLSANSNIVNVHIEKWEKHGADGGSTAHFTPAKVEYTYAKDEAAATAQRTTIDFVLESSTETYYECINRPNEMLLGRQTEGVDPTGVTDVKVYWASSSGKVSCLDATKYENCQETNGRALMTLSESITKKDGTNDTWQFTITPNGASPMGLQQYLFAEVGVQGILRYVDYIDNVVVEYKYKGQVNTQTMRIVRKSYHREDLPSLTFSINPVTYTFRKDAEGVDFNVVPVHQHGSVLYNVDNQVIDASYTEQPTEIKLTDTNWSLSFAFDGNGSDWLTAQIHGEYKILVNAANNGSGDKRSSILTCTFTNNTDSEHPHSGTFTIPLHQRGIEGGIHFYTQSGAGNDDNTWDPEIDEQLVHTAERTIYYLPNEEIELRLPESGYSGYMRWYDYETKGDPYYNDRREGKQSTSWILSPRAANNQPFSAINTPQSKETIGKEGYSYGLYAINKANGGVLDEDNTNNPAPRIKGWADGQAHTMACDVSAYTDYVINTKNGQITDITEPTLSYRQLFHLRPASEMADKFAKLKSDKYLEEYHYQAPAGKQVLLSTEYRHSKVRSHTSEMCYFYEDNSSNFKRINKNDLVWKVDGAAFTPNYTAELDYLRVSSNNYPATKVYTLTAIPADSKHGELRIARFVVDFVDIEKQGPTTRTIITQQRIRSQYNQLAYINFDEYNSHLPWDYTSYGYVYNVDPLNKTNFKRGAEQGVFPFYGEYTVVDSNPGKGWANQAPFSGKSLYVDGTMEPGLVATLSTKAVICSGQTLYCSAWFCNPTPQGWGGSGNETGNPIFRCNVQGREYTMNGQDTVWGEWENAGVYFVGELLQNSGWQQVVFPINAAHSYDETRVSIYNFATTNNGNDFMVDDISLFVSRLPIAAYQGKMACRSTDTETTSAAAVLRLDYSNINAGEDGYMYYQIYNESYDEDGDDQADGAPVNLTGDAAYYHESHISSTHPEHNDYGSVHIPAASFNPEEEYASLQAQGIDTLGSVSKLLDLMVERGQKHAKAYVRTVNNGVTKWLLYVAHIIENVTDNDMTTGDYADYTDEQKKQLPLQFLYDKHNYSMRMAYSPEELATPACNMTTPLRATQQTVFTLRNSDNQLINHTNTDGILTANGISKGADGEIINIFNNSYGNCANDLYFLTTKVINNLSIDGAGGEIERVEAPIFADWLIGDPAGDVLSEKAPDKNSNPEKWEDYNKRLQEAIEGFKEMYGYTHGQVSTAIMYDMRRFATDDPKSAEYNPNYYAKTFEELQPSKFLSQQNYDIIKHLYDNDWLQLYDTTVHFYLGSNETVRYWCFPIVETAKAIVENAQGEKIELTIKDCNEPRRIMVSSVESDYFLNVTPLPNDQKTPQQKVQLPTVKVVADANNTITQVSIPIKELTLKDGKNVKIGGTSYNIDGILNFSISSLPTYITFFNLETGKAVQGTPTLEVGKEYTMRLSFQDENGYDKLGNNNAACRVGYVFFTIQIVPNTMVWQPTGKSFNGWGLDANWRGWINDVNNNGIPDKGDTFTEGYVPMEGVDVVIPNLGNPLLYPYIVPEHEHDHYPLAVHHDQHKCRNIYFAAGAHINNQHLLEYENAFVDMQFPAAKWHLVSAPLQGMVSGDMFVPHNGWYDETQDKRVAEPNPFEVKAFNGEGYTGIRSGDAAYAFWQAFYNTTTTEGNTLLRNLADLQFTQSNTLVQPLTEGTGYAVYGLGFDEKDSLTIRLPKPDTQYDYYTNGQPNGTTVPIPTDKDRGRLAYTATHDDQYMTITLTNKTASEYFLFGNPTMAFVDMHALYLDNKSQWSGEFKTIQSDIINATTPSTMTTEDRYLPPMTSALLKVKNDATEEQKKSMTINLLPAHLTLNNMINPAEASDDDQTGSQLQAAPARRIADMDERPVNYEALQSELMTIYAFTPKGTARTVLATNPVANDYYTSGEDALFTSSGVENESYVTTPLNMYTIAEQVPMMADVRQGISDIPLAILAADKARAEHMQLAFYLSSNWTRECYFYDSQTGQKIRIMDGLVITIEMPQNHEQRYFIEGPDEYLGSSEDNQGPTTAVDNTSSSALATLQAFSLAQGELTIGSNQLIQEIRLYDLAGRLILDNSLTLLHTTTTVTAPSGICLVEAVLRDGTTLHTQALVK